MLRMDLYGIVRLIHCGFAEGLTWRAARSDDVGSYEKLARADHKTAAREICQVGSAAVKPALRRDEDGGPGDVVVAFVGSSAGPPAPAGIRVVRPEEREQQHRRQQRRRRDRAPARGPRAAHTGPPGPPSDHDARARGA